MREKELPLMHRLLQISGLLLNLSHCRGLRIDNRWSNLLLLLLGAELRFLQLVLEGSMLRSLTENLLHHGIASYICVFLLVQ